MKKKKVNPRRIPCTKADVNKAKKEACDEASTYAFAIMLTVLRDKYAWTTEQIAEFWGHVTDLSDGIIKGYVKIPDLVKCLEDEAGINLK